MHEEWLKNPLSSVHILMDSLIFFFDPRAMTTKKSEINIKNIFHINWKCSSRWHQQRTTWLGTCERQQLILSCDLQVKSWLLLRVNIEWSSKAKLFFVHILYLNFTFSNVFSDIYASVWGWTMKAHWLKVKRTKQQKNDGKDNKKKLKDERRIDKIEKSNEVVL